MEEMDGRLIRSGSNSLLDCGGGDTDDEGVMRKEELGVEREQDGMELYGCQRTLVRVAVGGLWAREWETACI